MRPMPKFRKRLLTFIAIPTLGIIFLAAIFFIYFLNKYYPGVTVGGINLTGLTKQQAQTKLALDLAQKSQKNLEFEYKGQTFDIDPKNLTIDQSVLDQAFDFGHRTFFLPPPKFNLTLTQNPALDNSINRIAQEVNQPPIDSSLKVDNQEINVTPSQDGQLVDSAALKTLLAEYINTGYLPSTQIPIKVAKPNLSYDSAMEIKNTLDKIKLSPVKLNFKDQSFALNLPTILSLIDLPNSRSTLAAGNFFGNRFELASVNINNQTINDVKLTLNQSKLNNYLKTIASQIDQPVEEPLFNFDGSKVTQFRPPQEGRELDVNTASKIISQRLLSGDLKEVELPVNIIPPKNQLVNQLGIKELIGEGVSNFYDSIPNRIYNINLSASKINGVLVPPGQEFSFDNTVGDITAATGYKQAYVIQAGHTVLGDGGGVCQVSTTLFRAVLNAGLPVTDRTAHAYRVGYYEQGFPPGLDATTYYPTVDFKFKNDTPASILIQAHTEGDTLYVDLYGTSDGRVAKISTPVVSGVTPPPPDLRQDDPTLPKGTVKQVDFSAWGANVTFNRTVTRNGQTLINETYHSNYRPWQAVYLVGTGG